jgi:predicted aspartyl protease
LSLHAMSSHPQQKAIQLRAFVQNQAQVILLDSGSSHTFLNSVIAQKLQIDSTPIHHMAVRVANGVVLPCAAEVKNFEWWIQDHAF